MRKYAVSSFAALAVVGTSLTASAQTSDTTTRGDWVGVYGQQGSVLSNFANAGGDGAHTPAASPANDLTVLPSYISSYTYGGDAQQYVWDADTTDTRAIENPAQTARRATTSFTNGSLTMTFDVNQAASFQLGVYNLDWDGNGARDQTVAVTVGGAPAGGTATLADFQNGTWSLFNVTANSAADDVVLTVTNLNPGTSNAVISAVTFDPIPEPAGLGLLALGGLGMLARRRAR